MGPEAEVEPAAAAIRFTVQVGAFSIRENAERRIAELEGYEPHIEVIRGEDGDPLYTVRIGTFESREQAEQEATAVRQQLSLAAEDGEAVLIRTTSKPLAD